MAVTHDDFSTELWTEVKNKLVAAGIITTASDSSTTAVSIKPSYDGKEASRPCIVVYPVIYDEGMYAFGGTSGKKTANVVIDCYASNTLYVDQIGDQVLRTINQNDIEGVSLTNSTSDYQFNAPGQNDYHLKSFTFTYIKE